MKNWRRNNLNLDKPELIGMGPLKKIIIILPLLGVMGCSQVMEIFNAKSENSAKMKVDSYFIPNPMIELTRISVVLPFGAVTEPTDKQGMISLAVDLMLKGARGYNSTQISERLALYGADVQIIVGRFYSVLQINVLTEYLEPCLQFLNIVLRSPTFSKQEFKILKEQYLSDIRSSLESNRRMLWRAYHAWYFAESPLNHQAGGSLKSITELELEDVKKWWQDHFGAHAVKLFVSSNLDESSAMKMITAKLGWIKPKPASVFPTADKVKTYTSGVDVLIINKPDSQTNDFMFAQPGMSFKTDVKDYYATHLANTAFGSGMQSRLFMELREKRGWTYHASSNYWGSFFHDIPVPWVIYSFPSLKFTDEAIPMAYQMTKDYVAKGLTPEEIELYRTNMIRMYPFTIDTPLKVLDKKFDEIIQGRYSLTQAEREKILKDVSNEQIVAALKSHLSTQNFVFLVVGDAKKLQKTLPKWFQKVSKVRVVQPDDVL
jgi:zinc protease